MNDNWLTQRKKGSNVARNTFTGGGSKPLLLGAKKTCTECGRQLSRFLQTEGKVPPPTAG